jgi:hypothetical protein
MKPLLDVHALLWLLEDDPQFSAPAKQSQAARRGGVTRVYVTSKAGFQNSPLYATMRSEVCLVPSLAR